MWDKDGMVIARPPASLGSEDLVQSIVSNIIKAKQQFLLDHPNIDELRRNKIHDIILVDDSIGSGDRVRSFIDMERRLERFHAHLKRVPWSFDKLSAARFAWPKGRTSLSPQELAVLVSCHPH